MIKQTASFAARSVAFSKFVALLEHVDERRPNLLRVLTYHRVDEPDARPALYPGLISATPDVFEQQMRYLAAHYNVEPVSRVLDFYQTRAPLPPRTVVITFDDATCDFMDHAWPALERHGLSATLFVPTAFPDHPERTFWWDRLHHAVTGARFKRDLPTPLGPLPMATSGERRQTFRRMRDYVKTLPHRDAMAVVDRICEELDAPQVEHNVLPWDALRRLAREGVTLGAHTRNHPLLNRISAEEVRDEAVGSLRDLQREIGPVPPIFAYPSGGYSEEAVHVLEREGFALAFGTARGINALPGADRLRLRRINVGSHTTLPILRARLLWSAYPNQWLPVGGT